MSAQVIQRGKLGELTKIGQGGQGLVYAAPNVKTKFAASMVYKEYKSQALAGIDFTALAAMPALVEDTLSYKEAERLILLAAVLGGTAAVGMEGWRPHSARRIRDAARTCAQSRRAALLGDRDSHSTGLAQ